MDSAAQQVFLRYWGSHFKNPRQAAVFLAEFQPLLAFGWRCFLVLERLPEDRSWVKGLLEAGVELLIEPRPRSRYDRRAVLRVWRLCRRIGATIMVCDNIHLQPLLGAALARVPVRIWWKRAMNDWYEEMRRPGWKERLALTTRLTCLLASRVFVVSAAVKRELLQLGIADRKIVVHCNPRKLGSGARAVSRDAARAGLGYSNEHLVIVSVGHAVPVKAWDVLLSAFSAVVARQPAARLLLVGSYVAPSERAFFAQLQGYIASQGLGEKVAFGGHVTDVRLPLSAADVFVLPSRSEGCANALVEALEVGIPCVSTRVGNAEEIINDGVNGLLVERGDQASLTEALCSMAADGSLRLRLAANAGLPPSIRSLDDHVLHLARGYHSLAAGNVSGSTLESSRQPA